MRARAIMWMFAAVSSVESLIIQREVVEYLESDKSWGAERMVMVEERIRSRLAELSQRLGDADWLDDAFSAGDLMMVQALRRLEGSELLAAFANLSAYVERGKVRPAFKRAFAAQLAAFTGSA
jgi:glutathione S-transferase